MLRDFGLGPQFLLTPLIGLEQQHTLNSSQTLYYSDQGSGSSYAFNATVLPESLTRATFGLRVRNRWGFTVRRE